MEETNENRINIEDLPQAEQELTTEEAKEVQGGDGATLQLQGSVTTKTGSNTYRGTTYIGTS
jgi:hypothetical protein